MYILIRVIDDFPEDMRRDNVAISHNKEALKREELKDIERLKNKKAEWISKNKLIQLYYEKLSDAHDAAPCEVVLPICPPCLVTPVTKEDHEARFAVKQKWLNEYDIQNKIKEAHENAIEQRVLNEFRIEVGIKNFNDKHSLAPLIVYHKPTYYIEQVKEV